MGSGTLAGKIPTAVFPVGRAQSKDPLLYSLKASRSSPSACHPVKPQELDQHNHDAEAEVEIPGGGARQDGRNFNSIPLQSQQQPSLPLHDEISDGNVKACDQQAKAEACDFEAHISC